MTVEAPSQLDNSGSTFSSTAEALQRLRELVKNSAGRWKRWMILEALALAVGLPLAYLWLVFLLDNLLRLPVWARLLANVVFVAVTIYLVGSLVLRWRRLRFTEDQVALAMERQTPGGVQNRLINALQISRDTRANNADFGHALIEENYKTLQSVVLRHAGQLRPAMLRVGFACAMIVVGLLFWSFQRERFQNAATRIMLPLADVSPIYQTVLEVEPGDIEAAGDIPIRIRIRGQAVDELTVFRVADGQRSAETIRVAQGQSEVQHTLKSVDRNLTYAVSGGDFTTRYYRVVVPTPSSLTAVKVTYEFPAYTGLPQKTDQSAGGDMEALAGTKAKVVFIFDHAADAATLRLHRAASTEQGAAKAQAAPATDSIQALPLMKLGPAEFAGEITFSDVTGYQIETRQASRPPHLSGRYAIHVRADEEPSLQLIGLDRQADASPDAVLPLEIDASDDVGLQSVGLYARKVSEAFASADPSVIPAAELEDGGWKPVQVWTPDGAATLRQDIKLAVAALGGAEGDKYEIAVRGADNDPRKDGALTTGQPYTLAIGGADIALQLLYEQILRTQAEIKALIASEEAATAETVAWIKKLHPASGLRWDDQANLDALAAGVKTLAGTQDNVRTTSGQIAREMVAQAGNLRVSIGLLADSEMVRIIRILESVPARDTVQEKRAALADAKMAQERTVRSLREIAEQYTRFRQEWELAHMMPFVKMLADRQAVLRDASAKAAEQPIDTSDPANQASTGRRQTKLAQLCDLARTAFDGLAERVKADEPVMGAAFAAASASLGAPDLRSAMNDAASLATAGDWAAAAGKQDFAAKALADIHQQLQAAKLEAARQALAAIQEKAKSDVEAQRELERLRAGSGENSLDDIDESSLKLAEIIHMREVAAAKKGVKAEDGKDNPYKFDDANSAALQSADSDTRQKLEHMSLATKPDGQPGRFPNQSDRKGNKVKPLIQEEFEDLVGELLEEADILQDKYDTYNINVAARLDEVGHVSKQGGDMNSTAAAAATGNQKPPPADQGGISRQGRMGARAHGMVLGDQGVNRRGRDEVQEGQERVPDQAGTIKQARSGDEQKDISTGIGGKQVETEDDTTFNTSDKGTFTEDMADRMGKVAKKNVIVERQDGKIDPRIADMLRDLEGTQEQVIERLKVIRKELKSLYLPTEEVDEAMAQLAANLESLKDRPSADIFRLQAQALDKLRGSLSVFTQHGAGFQPSLPRDQAVRGRVLDEPARRALPGYEEAVKAYYEALARP